MLIDAKRERYGDGLNTTIVADYFNYYTRNNAKQDGVSQYGNNYTRLMWILSWLICVTGEKTVILQPERLCD